MAAASEPASSEAMHFDPARVEALLKIISADQKNILTTLGLVLDGFASQTALLKELGSLAKDDPGPSPLAESLDKLTEAFLLVHEGLKGVSARLDHLPAADECVHAFRQIFVGSGFIAADESSGARQDFAEIEIVHSAQNQIRRQ